MEYKEKIILETNKLQGALRRVYSNENLIRYMERQGKNQVNKIVQRMK